MLKPGLELPEIDARELFNKVIENKMKEYKEILLEERSLVFECYEEYENNKTSLEIISQSKINIKSHKDALINCYTRNKNSLIGKEIVRCIINIQNSPYISNCPHCGYQITPETIDHYLPKSLFPEFSILPINMVPMCGRCNNIKSTDWRKGNDRLTINYYFDKMIEHRVLYAELEYSGDQLLNINYYLKKPPSMSHSDFRVIKNHFSTFRLKERYKRSSPTPLSVIKGTIKSRLDKLSLFEIRDLLKEEIRVKQSIFGDNYWEACLYESCLESDKFWESII